VVFIPGWFDIAPNDLTTYSIARRVLGRQRWWPPPWPAIIRRSSAAQAPEV